MAKKRSRSSYYGTTEEMIRRQRSGLVPGGNIYQKRKISEARYNCFWEYGDLEGKRFVYEGYVGNKSIEEYLAMTEKESKSEGFLNGWWASLELGSKRKREGKKFIYWAIIDPLTPEEKIPILEYTQKCLKKKLALLEKT